MPITVDEKILDFLTGIHGDRSNRAFREKKIYNRAFSLAYKDMSTHTVAYKKTAKKFVSNNCACRAKNKEKIKNAIRDYVLVKFKGLKSVTDKQGFDNWHAETCNHVANIHKSKDKVCGLVNEHGNIHDKDLASLLCHKDDKITDAIFTQGQAQKLVNMMVKYLYIYCQCEGITTLNSLCGYFHAPIDRKVLLAARTKETYPEGGKEVPWSKIRNYSTCRAAQADLKRCVDANPKYFAYISSTLFMWELGEWPFEQESEED